MYFLRQPGHKKTKVGKKSRNAVLLGASALGIGGKSLQRNFKTSHGFRSGAPDNQDRNNNPYDSHQEQIIGDKRGHSLGSSITGGRSADSRRGGGASGVSSLKAFAERSVK